MTDFDSRRTPARADLAAASLRGRVEAERYLEGVARAVKAASAPLRRRPLDEAPLDSEALHGESVTVYDERDGYAWAQLDRDGYVGYLPADALGPPIAPTHRVAALRTHAYPGPSIKAPPRFGVSLGALVNIRRFEGDFAIAADGAHYFARHLSPLDAVEPDFVAVAELFLNVPYLWGGRTSEGIDCSGLAQTALRAAGIPAPRDSDMLESETGKWMSPDSRLQRGDLVFWRGHVGIMSDAETLLHANGYHMRVVKEPLPAAKARIAASSGGPVTSVNRP